MTALANSRPDWARTHTIVLAFRISLLVFTNTLLLAPEFAIDLKSRSISNIIYEAERSNLASYYWKGSLLRNRVKALNQDSTVFDRRRTEFILSGGHCGRAVSSPLWLPTADLPPRSKPTDPPETAVWLLLNHIHVIRQP